MSDSILLALGLVFVLEGFFPALFPNKWCNYVQRLANEPKSTIRSIGFIMMAIGIVLIVSL